MRRLIEVNAPVEFRIPLIPEYTATDKNLAEILALLRENKVSKVHLLPYHSMGEAKAEKVGSHLPKLNVKPLVKEEINAMEHFFERANIQTILYR
jgi:pyruvate formate lyase activating enzyme